MSDPPASPEGEADGGQATKIRRALSTARDGGQERYPHSMFTRLRRRQRRPGFIFFMQNKSPLGIAKAWSYGPGFFTLCHCAFAPLCLNSYMITKEKISVIISVDRWLSNLIITVAIIGKNYS